MPFCTNLIADDLPRNVGGDQISGVSMPQEMKADIHTSTTAYPLQRRGNVANPKYTNVRARNHQPQILSNWAEAHFLFEQVLMVRFQHFNQHGRQGDRPS